MSRRTTTSSGDVVAPQTRRVEALAIAAFALTLLMVLALGSYDAAGQNLIGPMGHHLARLLIAAFGWVAWLIPLETALWAVRMVRGRRAQLGIATLGSTLVIAIIGCALVHLTLGQNGSVDLAGGVVGELFGEVLRSVLGVAGTFVVGTAVIAIATILRTPWTLEDVAYGLEDGARFTLHKIGQTGSTIVEAWREAREVEEGDEEFDETYDGPTIVGVQAKSVHVDDEAEEEEVVEREIPRASQRVLKSSGTEPTIVAPKPTRIAPEPLTSKPSKNRGEYKLPPPTLLDEADDSVIQVDPDALRQNAIRLTEKLAAYGVRGRVDEIHPGPVVTMYEFEPQSGTKVSKIAGLADDLAMALAAQKVRIVAPIPGKARVGFELPNEKRNTVYVREILEDRRWQAHKGSLPIALGKDIAGQPVYADLARMPHLLVAGATGAGKSVGLNVMLASMLCKKTPEQVRMLMIDPKVVELQVFDGIPHMLLPVVTDMKKAALALRWAVDEMERRYQLFADAGARNIDSYNQRVDRVLSGDLPIEKFMPKRRGKVKAQDENGEAVLLDAADGERADALDDDPQKLPFVVVVVDEFADLMMVAAKDVEACIARLAQKARAAGIHVILATQRPSVDVITGMIKANFPSRMAFKVSQRQDSVTILGRQGAEHLLGLGDMLMLPPGSSDLKRVHSAYISEDEVRDICDFLREQGEPVYQTDILKPREDDGALGGNSDDPLYDQAVQAVAEAGYCSISHVQRQLSVGYNKAAKLVERMEKEGVVGPPSSKAGGRREVLVSAA